MASSLALPFFIGKTPPLHHTQSQHRLLLTPPLHHALWTRTSQILPRQTARCRPRRIGSILLLREALNSIAFVFPGVNFVPPPPPPPLLHFFACLFPQPSAQTIRDIFFSYINVSVAQAAGSFSLISAASLLSTLCLTSLLHIINLALNATCCRFLRLQPSHCKSFVCVASTKSLPVSITMINMLPAGLGQVSTTPIAPNDTLLSVVRTKRHVTFQLPLPFLSPYSRIVPTARHHVHCLHPRAAVPKHTNGHISRPLAGGSRAAAGVLDALHESHPALLQGIGVQGGRWRGRGCCRGGSSRAARKWESVTKRPLISAFATRQMFGNV
jgi:hypothetical protein